jgi:hypothetical protein
VEITRTSIDDTYETVLNEGSARCCWSDTDLEVQRNSEMSGDRNGGTGVRIKSYLFLDNRREDQMQFHMTETSY